MNNRKRLLLRLAAMSLAILFSSAFAAAQERQSPATLALPTVNVDEPGRIPYQTAAFGHCEGTVCKATFQAIPAGHRLVIQHVSGNVSTLDPVPDGTRVLVSMNNQVQFISVPVAPFIPGCSLADSTSRLCSTLTAGRHSPSKPTLECQGWIFSIQASSATNWTAQKLRALPLQGPGQALTDTAPQL